MFMGYFTVEARHERTGKSKRLRPDDRLLTNHPITGRK